MFLEVFVILLKIKNNAQVLLPVKKNIIFTVDGGASYTWDGIHLMLEGYRKWVEILKKEKWIR